jgi:hypothetical protein
MPDIVIAAGSWTFVGRLEEALAPRTCAAFRRLLPLKESLLHVRWSGQATWIPLGDLDTGIGAENATVYPGVGDVLLYPGGVSETEILIPYGPTRFSSKAGDLAGNHFLTIVSGREHLAALGHHALWKGAQEITFSVP